MQEIMFQKMGKGRVGLEPDWEATVPSTIISTPGKKDYKTIAAWWISLISHWNNEEKSKHPSLRNNYF